MRREGARTGIDTGPVARGTTIGWAHRSGARRSGGEERLARVRAEICETIAPHDLRLDADQDCLADVHSLDLGMVRVVSSAGGRIEGEVSRTQRLIRASDPELCKIDLQLRGRAMVGQDDRQAALGEGAFTFVDLSRPSHVVGRLDGVAAVMFPRALLPLRFADTRELVGAVFDPRDTGAALVWALVAQLARHQVGPASDASAMTYGAAVLDLIVAALAARLDRIDMLAPDTRMRAITWRVKAFIEDRLADPGLAPPQIAATHHISLRQTPPRLRGRAQHGRIMDPPPPTALP